MQDKLTEDFVLHHRRLDHLTPMQAFNSYTKTLRKLPSSDRQRFKSMYRSRHGRLPTKSRAMLEEQELRELEALEKESALKNFYMYKSARDEAYYNYLMVKEGRLGLAGVRDCLLYTSDAADE